MALNPQVRATVLSLAVDGATVELARAFRADSIRWLLLKGPVVASRLYPNEHRPYSDADILVHPEDRAAASESLAAMGYAISAPLTRQDYEHARTWRRNDSSWSIDLHHRIPHVPAGELTTWHAFSHGSVQMEIADETIWTCGEGRLALLLALHALHHAPYGIKPRADLERAVSLMPLRAWQEALDVARSVGAERNLSAALALAVEGPRLRDDLGLRPVRRWEVALRSGEPARLTAAIEALTQARGLRAKLLVVSEELVVRNSPRRSELSSRYRTESSSRLVLRRSGHLALSLPGAIAAWLVLRSDKRSLSPGARI